jgi:hypothetical protein
MLENFGMSKGGKEYRRLVAAFECTFGATIFFGTDSLTSNAKVVHRSRFNFFSEARIWYNHGNNRLPSEPYENVIVLSNEFFKDVTAHPIPTDLEAVMLLSSAPAVLDLFVWLSYRCFIERAGMYTDLRAVWACAATWGCRIRAAKEISREKLQQWLKTIRLFGRNTLPRLRRTERT